MSLLTLVVFCVPFFFFFFFKNSHPNTCEVQLTVILIYVFLMVSNVERFFQVLIDHF